MPNNGSAKPVWATAVKLDFEDIHINLNWLKWTIYISPFTMSDAVLIALISTTTANVLRVDVHRCQLPVPFTKPSRTTEVILPMPTYFKPLRRKLGVGMLVLACLSMAGWIRSFVFHNEVSFNTDDFRESLSSHRGRLYWARVRVHPSDNLPFLKRFNWQNTRLAWSQSWWEENTDHHWKWHFLGIGVQNFPRPNGGNDFSFFVTPYWPIVPPLTAVSAWLLLSKPRVRKPSATAPTE